MCANGGIHRPEADGALGCIPHRESHVSAALQYPKGFPQREVGIGQVTHAVRVDDGVELAVIERQCFGIRLLVCVRETDEAARAAAEALVAEVPEHFEGMMQKHMTGADSEGEKRQRMLREQGEWIGPNLWTGIGRARLGVGLALVGSGENVAARIREYVEEGIDTFIFSGYPHKEESERFGQYVMPHFRGEAAVSIAPRELVQAGGQA